jgi:hypothetical protein
MFLAVLRCPGQHRQAAAQATHCSPSPASVEILKTLKILITPKNTGKIKKSGQSSLQVCTCLSVYQSVSW